MSVWSSENDSRDRMLNVVATAKLDAMQRHDLLAAKCAEAVKLLRDVARYDAQLTADECTELADLLESATDQR